MFFVYFIQATHTGCPIGLISGQITASSITVSSEAVGDEDLPRTVALSPHADRARLFNLDAFPTAGWCAKIDIPIFLQVVTFLLVTFMEIIFYVTGRCIDTWNISQIVCIQVYKIDIKLIEF